MITAISKVLFAHFRWDSRDCIDSGKVLKDAKNTWKEKVEKIEL